MGKQKKNENEKFSDEEELNELNDTDNDYMEDIVEYVHVEPEFDMADEEDYYDSNGNMMIQREQSEEEQKRDKIFGNAFNTGDTQFHDLPDIKADDHYADDNLDHVYDAEAYNMRTKLSKMCSDAFDASQWSGLPLSKKFSKELMPYIFQDLFKILDVDGHSAMDCFIAIAEFMDVSYEKVYWSAGMKVKERLIAECNAKFGSLDKKNINRLF